MSSIIERYFKSSCAIIFVWYTVVPFHVFAGDSTVVKSGAKLYFLWGYNREVYTKSNIRFYNNGDPNRNDQYGVYDFTIYNAVAHDKPDFDNICDVINITVPQYNARIGYYFNNKKDWGIEMSYDHTKYIVTEGQTVRVKGTINGRTVDQDTVLDWHYFHFEHSDGANFWMLNVMKRWKLYDSKNGNANIGLVVKPGLGVVFPRSDVTLFGNQINNKFHIAGVIAGIEAGLRAELWKHLTVELTGKATIADYARCLVYKKEGRASHKFGTLQAILALGYQLGW